MPRPPLPELDYWSVPRCWPGETVAILAGGRTLTQRQADHVRGKCRVIAINRAGLTDYRVSAPWADWLYGCDADAFWKWHPKAVDFAGTKIVVRPSGNVLSTPARWPILQRLAAADVKILRHSNLEYPGQSRHEGVSGDPRLVRGNNSLHQVLSVIQHTGTRTILLLGADMRGGHFHGGYGQAEPNFASCIIPNFAKLVRPLASADVAVFNCCPTSAIPYWPRVRLEDVI